MQRSRGPDQEDHAARECGGLVAALVVFALAFVALAWPWLSGRLTVPWDAKSQFYPQLRFLADALHRGDSPFWAPNIYAGWPQVADPQSLIFSPPHLALAWLNAAPSFQAADAVTFAALFLGASAILLYFHDRGWGMAGAALAALAFAFGGSCASRLQHTGQILSIAYLPLALFFLGRALDRASLCWGAAAGVAVALVAVGRDQVALLSLYVLVGYAAVGVFVRGRAVLAPLVLCGAVALALALVPVTLTGLLAESSNRPAIDFASAGRGSLHPVHLLTLAVADLFGANDPRVAYWAPPSLAWNAVWGPSELFIAQNVGQLYAGALTVLAAAFALASGAAFRREALFFTVVGTVALVYALGWHTPAFRVLYEIVPGVQLFRRPADATFVLTFAVAMLAGYGLHRWLVAPRIGWRTAVAIVSGALAVFGLAVGVAVSVGRLDVAVAPLATSLGCFVAGIVALFAARGLARRSPFAALVVIAAALTADLAWNNAPNESTGLPPATYDALAPDTRNETVRLVRERLATFAAQGDRARAEISAVAYDWPNLGLAQGFDGLFGQNPLRLDAFARATGIGDTVAIPEQRTFAPLFPSYRSTMADLLGLRLVVTGVPAERLDGSLQPGDLTPVARTKDAFVYANPRALPRALLVARCRRVDVEDLLRFGWPGDDPRQIVLLERDHDCAARPAAPAGTARIVDYASTRVVVEADAPGRAFLVLNDMRHPWWTATIDGVPVDILRANVLFRAVDMPPGRHVVRFEFAPLSQAAREISARIARAVRRNERGGSTDR